MCVRTEIQSCRSNDSGTQKIALLPCHHNEGTSQNCKKRTHNRELQSVRMFLSVCLCEQIFSLRNFSHY